MKKKAKIKSNLELSREIRGVWGINPVTRIHDKDKKAQIRKQRRNNKGLCRQELYDRRPSENKTGPSFFAYSGDASQNFNPKSCSYLLKLNIIYYKNSYGV